MPTTQESAYLSRESNSTGWFVGIIVALALLAIAYLVFSASQPDRAASPLAGSTVFVDVGNGHGSGVYLGNGYVLTAAHVTDGKTTVTIKTDKGASMDGRVLWGSLSQGGYDVSLVYVPGLAAETSPLACWNKPYVGEEIVLKGNPEGVLNATSWGKIGGLSQTGLEGSAGTYGWMHLVTLDLTAAPGNSGGPVFDASGNVIGLLVAGMVDQQRGTFNFSFMVPASDICVMLGRTS